MNKLYCLLIVAMVTPLLSGCLDNGSSAPPPSAFTATQGDGRVKLQWIPSPGVDYWLFTATNPGLTAFNWINLPSAHVSTRVTPPYYVCNLLSGTTYYYAMNGRINGGPGGPSSPTISATPYDASTGTWTLNPTSLIQNIYGVGYTSLTTCSNNATSATGSFAAVGAGGAIFTSSDDGKTWIPPTNPPSGFSTDLYAVTGYAAYQNNLGNPALRWVAVGAGGASIYSTDGSNWFVGRADLGNPALRSLTHVGGTFFAAGDTGTILSSGDGITWTAQTSGTTANLNGVMHGSIFVAVGDSGTILTSSNGNIWTAKATVTANPLRQAANFGSVYVAVGDAGTIVTSKDGGNIWTAQNLTGSPNLVGVAAEFKLVANAVADPVLGYISPAQFVAVDSTGNIYTSPNGVTWSGATNSTGISTNALVASGFGYIAAGNAGATAYAF